MEAQFIKFYAFFINQNFLVFENRALPKSLEKPLNQGNLDAIIRWKLDFLNQMAIFKSSKRNRNDSLSLKVK